jgi:hypothetical protein
MTEEKGCTLCGAFWMLLLSLLLVWLPGVGSLIAGVVGGKVAGSLGKAFVASLVPSFLLAGVLFFAGTMLTGVPGVGAVLALGGFVVTAIYSGTLILGAIIGGLMA